MDKKIEKALHDIKHGTPEQKKKAYDFLKLNGRSEVTVQFKEEVRNYKIQDHDNLIPLAYAALVPFLNEEKPFRPMQHLLLRLLNAMIDNEFTVFQADTRIPLHEYLKLDVLPDGLHADVAPFDGFSLVRGCCFVSWLYRNDYLFAADVRKQLGVTATELEADADHVRQLLPKERHSLLCLVIGMAVKGYGFDPSLKRSDVTAQISSDLEASGVPLEPDTVRKWLREGTALLPPKR